MVQDPLVRFPPNRRAAAKQQTRLRLVNAARELVAERGYEAATLRDVAERARVSTGAVFASFEDKADLFNAVLLDDQAALLVQVRRAAEGAETAREALFAMLMAGYEQFIDQPSLVQAHLSFSWSSDKDLERRRAETRGLILEALAGALREGLVRGELAPPMDTALVAEMAWDGYVAGWRRVIFDAWDLDGLGQYLMNRIDVLLDGFRTDRARARADAPPVRLSRPDAPPRRALHG
jgi:AcrR family transcriptional regulator